MKNLMIIVAYLHLMHQIVNRGIIGTSVSHYRNKLLIAGGCAYNTATESGVLTFDANGHISNTWWATGSAKKYHI